MPTLRDSEFNYACAKHVRYAFGLTEGQLLDMIAKGRVKMYRRFKNPLVIIDSLAEAMYADRDNVVLKRWGYDYESVHDKYAKAMKSLHSFPRCFFKADAPVGFYRVFYRKKMLKVLVYVMEDFVRCICYNRPDFRDLETVYGAFAENRIDIEE
jgi:hypothetical protein